MKREVGIQLEIQEKMKKLLPKPKKKKKVTGQYNFLLDLHHCPFEEECQKEFKLPRTESNPFELTEDDDEYGPLDFIREHFYPEIPASLVYEAEHEHYFQEQLRDRLRDDEWVEAVIQKEENEYRSPSPSSTSNPPTMKFRKEQYDKKMKERKERKGKERKEKKRKD